MTPAPPDIPLTRPFVGDEELEEIRSVIDSGHLAQGERAAEFERIVGGLLGSAHAFATSSCTTALHLSLAALGIGAGDEVIVPDFTFPATANVVVQQGATPVFADISLETYNIDPSELAERVSPRTRAIIPVHLFGLSAPMEPIMVFAREHELVVVEDAACGIGATYRGRLCGTFGDTGCFSFHPRKLVTTGEGGMIVTEREDLAAIIATLRNHGSSIDESVRRFTHAGFNYRLSDVQAAVGIAQMRRFDEIVELRRALADALRRELAGLPLTLPAEPAGFRHTYQSFVVLLEPEIDRNRVIADLASCGIEATLGTYALHAQPFFRELLSGATATLPRSLAAHRQSLALPFYPQMTAAEVSRVAETLSQCIGT